MGVGVSHVVLAEFRGTCPHLVTATSEFSKVLPQRKSISFKVQGRGDHCTRLATDVPLAALQILQLSQVRVLPG